MLQDRAWATIIARIVEAVLGDIHWRLATRAPGDGFEYAVEAMRVDLAKTPLLPRIVHYRAWLREAARKEFTWPLPIKLHHLACIVVHPVVRACAGRVFEWRQRNVERKRETPGLGSFQQRPVQ